MAISDDTRNNVRDGNLERDPRLTRLMKAAGGEAPPQALDAAILAAARREVRARPLAATVAASSQVAGAGESVAPVPRQKRNWYVPVSIAAVLVMSASLVTIVYQEKGDELTNPPHRASAPTAAPAPQAPKETAKETAASAKPGAAVHDAEPAKLKVEAAKRAEALPSTAVAESADSYAKKQRKQSETVAADRTTAIAKIASGSEVSRRDTQTSGPADRAASAPTPVTVLPEGASRPGTALGGAAAGAAAPPAAPPAPVRESRPEPFPAASEQASAQAQRDAAASARQRADVTTARERADVTTARARAEADRNVAREVMRDAPAPPLAEGRVSAMPPPRLAAKSATAPLPQRSSPQQAPRPAWLTELDNQSPEKWLERFAQFKRDGQQADADELMAEFRRRFPDHPASAR